MTHRDESWKKGEHGGEETLGESVPRRFALTGTQVLRSRSSGKLLLIDPHPSGTWENWMFPYSSLVLEESDLHAHTHDRASQLTISSSLSDLEQFLDSLVEAFHSEYVKALEEGVNNVLPEITFDDWPQRPDLVTYSLKFSKTSDCFTGYRFEYAVGETSVENFHVPFTWLAAEDIASLGSDQLVEGKKLSSNVVDLAAELARW
ncbi:hypothetical protein [Mycobacterium mantenii]|uniref:hypothetical protein n=1 Tax=Mycobacterium mantenii TaxID=560555 RepID=UPI00104206B9|nr:hypothetical protein [Mycobacterium mantenii]